MNNFDLHIFAQNEFYLKKPHLVMLGHICAKKKITNFVNIIL